MSSLTLPYSRWYSAFNFFLNHLLLFALLLTEYNMYSKSPTHEWGQFWEYVHKSNFFVSPTKLSWVPANKILYLVLYCNRFVIVSANIIHSKQKTNTKNKEKIFNLTVPWKVQFSSVQSLSLSVMSNSLWPHESQHTRPPCPSQTSRVDSNPCPLSQRYQPAISSSIVPFSSCPQSLPASGSFPMSQLFAWGGQSIGIAGHVHIFENL